MAELSIEAPARHYRNFIVDTTRWQRVALRRGDIVLSTPPKAGTTWAQSILAYLLVGDTWPSDLHHLSPWVEMRILPLDEVVEGLEAQPHRRFMKSHIARDGLPFSPDLSYVVVARDPRDVFMSWFHFRRNWNDELIGLLNEVPGRVGDPVPPFEDDLHEHWKSWLTRGWFEGERDGFPMMSTFHHLQSWWDERERPNVLLMHYSDMLRDLPGEIARLAAFLDLELSGDRLASIVEATSFESMKREADKFTAAGAFLRGGAKTFFHKGTNERWRGVFSEEGLALYERVAADRLSPECARWVAEGRHAVGL